MFLAKRSKPMQKWINTDIFGVIFEIQIEIVLGKTEKYASMSTPTSATQAREKEAVANNNEEKKQ